MKKLCVCLVSASLLAGVFALPVRSAADDKPKPTPEERFKRLDKNGDGKLSLAEFQGKQTDAEKVKKAFEARDKDKDGFLSLEEFKAGIKTKTDK